MHKNIILSVAAAAAAAAAAASNTSHLAVSPEYNSTNTHKIVNDFARRLQPHFGLI